MSLHKRPLLNIYTVAALCCSFLALSLLLTHELNGSEFVAFIVVIVSFSIIIKVLPEIKEFSVAGYSIKLKETLSEAERITDKLKTLELQTKSIILDLIKRVPGGFSSIYNYDDERYPEFIKFYESLTPSLEDKGLINSVRAFAIELKDILLSDLTNRITGDKTSLVAVEDIRLKSIEQNPDHESRINECVKCIKRLEKIINELGGPTLTQ
ncbi:MULTISPECIES: hypothetical protein [Yersinia]|uniref:hypothetical protein n=1 Tax=Yersinia TaxID=629 RepID=UPI0005E85642|nr:MULTISPECIES: hypothetical protein [Yersinia]EKN3383994.1 hypothetical protein [Yersinia enterocolitica]EKN3469281.1 hypothetical protein [Yersinia enterocolitica]EKN3585647.1 hypothetical protein [Yersinia enterocolitica]EKN3589109.1 hypothetical protein [Yersinia enterocolitica]EKN3765956.1 hypothetical protein [Yersinia enterocolitica]